MCVKLLMRSVFLITLVCSVPVMLLKKFTECFRHLSLISNCLVSSLLDYCNINHQKIPKKTENLQRRYSPANKLLNFRDNACHVFNFPDCSGKILKFQILPVSRFWRKNLEIQNFAARILKTEDFSTHCNLTLHHNSPLC